MGLPQLEYRAGRRGPALRWGQRGGFVILCVPGTISKRRALLSTTAAQAPGGGHRTHPQAAALSCPLLRRASALPSRRQGRLMGSRDAGSETKELAGPRCSLTSPPHCWAALERFLALSEPISPR